MQHLYNRSNITKEDAMWHKKGDVWFFGILMKVEFSRHLQAQLLCLRNCLMRKSKEDELLRLVCDLTFKHSHVMFACFLACFHVRSPLAVWFR